MWWKLPVDLFDVGWVCGEVIAALHAQPERGEPAPPKRRLLLRKSLGTLAANLAAEGDLPAIWLTPLLYDVGVAEARSRTTASTLLIGGTADESWRADVARKLGHPYLEIERAQHLRRPDRPLRHGMARYDHYFDGVPGEAAVALAKRFGSNVSAPNALSAADLALHNTPDGSRAPLVESVEPWFS